MITLLCALLGFGLFIYVFAPMGGFAHAEDKTRTAFLNERKEVIYENLRDLNFEHKAGKFSESDFLEMRSSLENEAAAVLAEIEDIEIMKKGKSAR